MPDTKDSKRYTELQTFSYHSGAQISVWFGNIWVNDISSISWQYMHEKRPIYGYASTYFDAVARGQVIVQGSFSVNFRQRDYISFVINSLAGIDASFKTLFTRSEARDRWQALQPTISNHLRNKTFGPRTQQELVEFGMRSDFWETVDAYEQVLWGDLADKESEKMKPPDVLQHEDHRNGFDIQIIYGENSDKSNRTMYEVMSSTEKIIRGAHLTGSAQTVHPNGEPIQEVYSFFAKDVS